jgi:hypothetical protein
MRSEKAVFDEPRTKDLQASLRHEFNRSHILFNWSPAMIDQRKYLTESELARPLKVISKSRDGQCSWFATGEASARAG